MNDLLLGIVLLTPLAVLLMGWYRDSRWSLLPATLPPLVAAVFMQPGETIALDWLLLGARLGTDGVTQWLLPAAVLVWTAAAVMHARLGKTKAFASRFRLFFLVALWGNLLLLLAQDAVTFYVGYAVMGIAGYGLVLDPRSLSARVAAGRYLRWTIAGELLIFSGLVRLASEVGSTFLPLAEGTVVSAWTLALLIGGFGIKIGLPGLHAWMPATYAASSIAGSAVFSGAMANAGILGLMHFMPMHQPGHATAGMLLLGYGLAGAFYGVLLGLPQRHPKVILAYSSISQLGTLAALVGLALMAPPLAPALVVALTLYAVHHGLIKAALFLALDGVGRGPWRGVGLGLLAVLSLAMAGLPFTSGAVAKALVKDALLGDHAWLISLLDMAGVATALLMTRFLFACLATSRRTRFAFAWGGVGLAFALMVVAHVIVYRVDPVPALSAHAIWPLTIAMLLAIGYAILPARAHSALQPVIPKGDLPNLLAKALLRLAGRYQVFPTIALLISRTARAMGAIRSIFRADLGMSDAHCDGPTPKSR